MPVKCKLQNGKYRIIGPDGAVEKNRAGTAVDGGGHGTKIACQKQATAINTALSSYGFEDMLQRAEPNKASVLVHEGALPLATSSAEDEVQRFKKDMIKLGVYIHPVHNWKLSVTAERMQRWLTNFQEMQKNGIDIEFPLDHSLSAEKNLGYVVDAMIEEDANNVLTLFGIIEVKGQNAIDIVRRNRNVSVWIAQDYKDGKGNYYGEVIKHCAVVQQPVVSRQENFIPIAASETGIKEEIPIFYQRRNAMTKEQLEKLRKLFGLGEDVKEEDLLSTITKQQLEGAKQLKKIQDENLALKAAASTSDKDKNKTASKMDLNTLELVGSTIADKIQLLVEKGRVLPAVAKKLSAALAGAQGKRTELTLCLGENASPSIASQVIDALQDNDPVKLGEATKSQTLSRQTPGDDEKKADEEGADAMMSGAGVEVDEKKKD